MTLFVIGAVAGDDDPDEEQADATTSTAETVDTTEPEAPATTPPPETTTPESTTSTPATTTAPTEPELTPALAAEIMPLVFSEVRGDLIAGLEADQNVQSVDRVEYLEGSEIVLIDITSTWAGDEARADGAWELTRAMAGFWEDGNGWYQAGWAPGFTLVQSGVEYACPAEFMIAAGAVLAGRSDWETVCAP